MPLGAVAVLMGCVGALASIGDHAPMAGFAAVVETALGPGMIALGWLLGAIGMGVWLVRGSWTLGACVGVGVALTLAHLMGAMGAFSGKLAQPLAMAPPVVGIALLARRWWLAPPSGRVSRGLGAGPMALAGAPALGVLIVACCLPAGTIWASEARGYDVLSYHLQLVDEWRRGGRIAPIEHNVYSFLPSYVEAAYTQIDAMLAPPGGVGRGMAHGASAAQFLHALLTVLGAIATGRLALSLMERAGVGGRASGAVIATLLALCVPWVVVTGSLAYNEAGVLVAYAGALLATTMDRVRPLKRGALAGGLCAVAVSCKLTSAYLCVPGVAIATLMLAPRREWRRVLLGAAVAGSLVLMPWLVRNAIHSGNPVFPFATGLFGAAHWTSEQAARWTSAHSPDAGLAGRLALLFSMDRGLLHPQWSVFALVTIGGLAVTIRDARTRRVGLLLAALTLATVAAWAILGHQQSRFLLPLVVPGAAAGGVAIASLQGKGRALIARLAGVVAALAMGVHSGVIFAGENAGRPNYALVDGAPLINGREVIDAWSGYSTQDQRALWEHMGPIAASNLLMRIDPGMRIALIGDATPMYFSRPVIYHSTWDESPLGRAARAGRDPIVELQSLGATHLLINFSELERLTDLGWYDPDVSPDSVRERVLPRCSLVRGWPELGVALVGLPPRGAPGAE